MRDKRLPLVGLGMVPGCFWRPSYAFLDELVATIGERRVLEVFSGNGYLAAHLAARGVQIRATSRRAGHDAHEQGFYCDVEEMDAVQAVQTYGADAEVLLMCWPTTTPAAWRAALAWGAEKDIIFIGEVTDYAKGHLGGCATDEFFEDVRFVCRLEAYNGSYLEAALIGRLAA